MNAREHEPAKPRSAPDESAAEQSAAEEVLRDRISRLESIIDASGIGTFEWNVQSGRIICNECYAEMLGYSLAELQPFDAAAWVTLAHPEDLPECRRQLEKHFEGAAPQYDCECRMRRKDGSWVWVVARGRVCSRTVDGKPLMMLGTQYDITARKQAEDALRQSEAFLATIYRNSELGIFLVEVSQGGDFTFSGVNPAHERLIGVPNAQVIGKSPKDRQRHGHCAGAPAPYL